MEEEEKTKKKGHFLLHFRKKLVIMADLHELIDYLAISYLIWASSFSPQRTKTDGYSTTLGRKKQKGQVSISPHQSHICPSLRGSLLCKRTNTNENEKEEGGGGGRKYHNKPTRLTDDL